MCSLQSREVWLIDPSPTLNRLALDPECLPFYRPRRHPSLQIHLCCFQTTSTFQTFTSSSRPLPRHGNNSSNFSNPPRSSERQVSPTLFYFVISPSSVKRPRHSTTNAYTNDLRDTRASRRLLAIYTALSSAIYGRLRGVAAGI